MLKIVQSLLDWISYHLQTDDEFASVLKKAGYSRDEAKQLIKEYREIPDDLDEECLICGYDDE